MEKRIFKARKKLKKLLKNFNFQIEHIGSTSIIGCSAKPIIDIAIGVQSLEYGKQLIPILPKAPKHNRNNERQEDKFESIGPSADVRPELTT